MHKFRANIQYPMNPILISKSTPYKKCVSGYKGFFGTSGTKRGSFDTVVVTSQISYKCHCLLFSTPKCTFL